MIKIVQHLSTGSLFVSKEWIYGSLCNEANSLIMLKGEEDYISCPYISKYDKHYYLDGFGNLCAPRFYNVHPDTVGQYTGLVDKNGRKIFEGDVVHAVYQSNYVGCKNIDFGIGVVKYLDSYYGGAAFHIDIIGESGSRIFTASLENGVEVIGNVHDNPELLKG